MISRKRDPFFNELHSELTGLFGLSLYYMYIKYVVFIYNIFCLYLVMRIPCLFCDLDTYTQCTVLKPARQSLFLDHPM